MLTPNLPVAVDDVSYATDEDTVLAGSSVLQNDTDADGDTIDAAILDSTTSNGTLVLNSDGTFTYTPDADFVGTDSFTYFAQDTANSETSASPATVTITVSGVNDAPVANPLDVNVGTNVEVTGTVSASDVDGDSLTYAVTSTTTNGTLNFNTSDGSFTYTPDADFTGTDEFTFVANDGTVDSAPATVTFTITNTDPVAVGGLVTTDEDAALSGTLVGSDVNGDDLTFAAGATSAANGTVVINSDGTFTYTPNADFNGTDSFTFVVNDGTSTSAEATMTVVVNPVNDAPVAVGDSLSVNEDTVLTGTLTGADVDGDVLTYSAGSITPQHGTLIVNASGAFIYTPDSDFSGTDSFSFLVDDGTGGTDEATVNITVNTVNDIPVALPGTFSVDEDLALNAILSGSDADGDSLTFSQGTVAAAHGTVAINPNGTFTYTPDTNFSGTDTFSFKVNDGTADSAEATATITVNSINDAPLAIPQTLTVSSNTTLEGTLTATDPEGDTLTFAAGSIDAAHGTVVVNADGTFTYIPDADYNGPDSFSFTASDGTATSAEATVTIAVLNNVLPVADSVTLTTEEDTELTGTLTATDADGDPLTFALGSTSAAHGTVTVNPDGTFVYTPDANFNGTDTFTFYASDAIGNSAEATATVNVTAVNDLPIADTANFSTDEDVALTGSLTASDAEGDTLTFVAGSVAPQHGTVTVNPDGTFLYTPAVNFNGTDTFTFLVNDGTGTSAEATATVTVNAVNDDPVAQSVTLTTSQNTDLNGTLTATDEDGDNLTYLVGSVSASNGTVVINSDGTFTYTPNTNFTGTDTFSFIASDGMTSSAEATVTVNVAANTLPVANAQNLTVSEDTTLSGTLTATDADSDTLTYFLGSTSPTGGTVVVNPDGTFTYTPNANFNGSDSFSFYANDGTGNSEEATVNIGVSAVNDIPVAAPGTFTIDEDASLTGNLSATDPEGDSLTYVAGSVTPTNGTVVINSDGSFTYTPNANFNGTDTFSFKANDGTNDSEEATVTVTVNSVAEIPTANPATFTVTPDTQFSGTLTGTDPDGNPLTFAVGSTTTTNGTLVINSDGTFTYQPNSGFNGTDTFTYTVNNGSFTSPESTVTLNVTSVVNTPPVANDLTLSTAVNSAVNGTLTATDAEGDLLTFSQGSIGPSNGTVTINSDGTFLYTPNASFTGTDSFTFVANDGSQNSTEGTVTVTVGVANQSPVVIDGSATIDSNAAFNGSLAPLGSDAEGDSLAYSIIAQPAHGTLTLNPGGTFTYTPDANFTGVDTFTFKANDGTTDSNTGTFTLTVQEVTGLTLTLSGDTTQIPRTKDDTPIDSSAIIEGGDDVNFANASLGATLSGNSSDAKGNRVRLTVRETGGVEVKGKRLFVNGVQVGTVTGGKKGSPLVFDFNGGATKDDVEAVLKQLSLKAKKKADAGARTVDILLTADGETATATKSVTIV